MHKAITQHRHALTTLIPLRAHDVKYLSPGQIIFLLTLHDIETLRSRLDLSSSLISYFVNEGLNKSGALALCMDAMAENVRLPFEFWRRNSS